MVGGQRHVPAALPPGKIRYPLYRRLVAPAGLVWTVAGNLAPTMIRSPDRPARTESLYRMSYPGPHMYNIYICTFCSFQSGIGTGFSLRTSVFPCQYHSTSALCASSSKYCCYQKDTRAELGNLKEVMLCGKLRNI